MIFREKLKYKETGLKNESYVPYSATNCSFLLNPFIKLGEHLPSA